MSKIAYIIHAHYPGILRLILDKVSETPCPFDTYISVTPELLNVFKVADIYNIIKNVVIIPVENRGRDIYPWLKVNKQFDFSKYDAVCKLHTKKTPHSLNYGELVRNMCVQGLIGSSDIIESNINTIINGVTMIAPKGLKKRVDPNEYNQKPNVALLNKLFPDIDFEKNEYYFSAGSMFWYDPKTLMSLFDFEKYTDDYYFEPEPINVDYETPHLFERLLGCVVAMNNLKFEETP